MTDASDAARGNSGSADGTSSTAGQIDGARIFNGTTDVITVSPSASIDNVFQGGGTAEAWLFLTDWGEGGFGRVFDRGPSNMVLSTCQGNGGRQGLLFGRTFAQNVGNWCTLDGTLALDAWFYVAVVYDDSTQMNRPTMYINGQQESFANVGNPTGSRLDDSATLAIGNRIGGDRAFAGQLDELRLSHTSRSAEWIATSFADQSDPASFCTFAP
jgi:hypothetical protein